MRKCFALLAVPPHTRQGKGTGTESESHVYPQNSPN